MNNRWGGFNFCLYSQGRPEISAVLFGVIGGSGQQPPLFPFNNEARGGVFRFYQKAAGRLLSSYYRHGTCLRPLFSHFFNKTYFHALVEMFKVVV